MRWLALAVALVLLSGLSGCLEALAPHKERPAVRPADVGYDANAVSVTGVQKSQATITSFDQTPLSAVIDAPVTGDTLPDGSPVRWGIVVFLHGWGDSKEFYEGAGGATGAPLPPDPAGQGPHTAPPPVGPLAALPGPRPPPRRLRRARLRPVGGHAPGPRPGRSRARRRRRR